MKPFTVNIVTPEKTAYSAQAVSVTLPGTEGYLGVWADHAPLVSGLRPGVITIKLNDASNARLGPLLQRNCSGERGEIHVFKSKDTCRRVRFSCQGKGRHRRFVFEEI